MEPSSVRGRSTKDDLSSTTESQLFRLESRQETIRLIVGSLLFALVFCYPLICDFQYLGPGLEGWLAAPDLSHFTALPINGDSDMFAELRWVPYYTITHFHQLPFWNPYKCGGMTMLGNPESGIVTPFLLFYLIFGLVPGMLLDICLHVAIGFAGGYLLGRELGLKPLACVAIAAMFPSSSWLPLHISVGHLNFLPAVYFPWIIALLLAACRTRRWFPAALGGLFCALTLTEGNYTFVYAAMLVAIVAVTFSIIRLSVRPLIAAALIAVFAFGFGALKLIPTEQWLILHPRPDFGSSWLTWRGALVSLFSRNQDLYRPSTGPFYFCEFGGYLGAAFVVLALIGIAAAGRNAIAWIIGIAAFFMLFRGNTSPHALITYERLIPLGNNMGLCGRWVIPLVFCVSALAGLGTQFVSDHLEAWGPRLATLLVTVAIIDAWIVCSPNYRYINHTPFEGPPHSASFRQYWVDNPTVMTYIAKANMGSVDCSAFGYHVSRGSVLGYNEPGYRGEQYLLGLGSVTLARWTPNRLEYVVDAPGASVLVVNQNYDPSWRVTSGPGQPLCQDGLLAVRMPAGKSRIVLRYISVAAIWGMIISILSAFAAFMLFRSESRRPLRDA